MARNSRTIRARAPSVGTPVLSFHAMHTLRCRLSDSLWHALQARHRATGESMEHIVRAALADRLQVDHSTLFQISSSAALVEGIYKGASYRDWSPRKTRLTSADWRSSAEGPSRIRRPDSRT